MARRRAAGADAGPRGRVAVGAGVVLRALARGRGRWCRAAGAGAGPRADMGGSSSDIGASSVKKMQPNVYADGSNPRIGARNSKKRARECTQMAPNAELEPLQSSWVNPCG